MTEQKLNLLIQTVIQQWRLWEIW